MTTINCSSNCIHQKDGICMLENAATSSSFIDSTCIYFDEKIAVSTAIADIQPV